MGFIAAEHHRHRVDAIRNSPLAANVTGRKGLQGFLWVHSICYSISTILGVTLCSKIYGLTSNRTYHFLAHLAILVVGVMALMLVYLLDLEP